jgi:hypothetical protein
MANGKLSFSDCLYHLLSIKEHFRTDLNRERDDIQVYVRTLEKRKRAGQDPSDEAEQRVSTLWKELIEEATKNLVGSIDKRKTRGVEFAVIKSELEKILEELPYTRVSIQTLQSTYNQTLRQRREEVKEKIEIERYNNRRFWIGILIGFIGGVITSIVVAWVV